MKNNINDFCYNNAANFVTILNMVFGTFSITASIHSKFSFTIGLIFLASVADRYDGKIARKLNTDSPLGVQLDSMGDVISFGLAPAILIYMSNFLSAPHGIRLLGMIGCVFYVACGGFRLARYNISGLSENNTFTGLPITIAGTLLVAIYLIFRSFIHPLVYCIILLLLGFLEISKIAIKKA